MYFAVIDCGTTNSRVYIVNGKKEIAGKAAKKVGVRDTAIQGSNDVLKVGLKETFLEAVQDAGLKLPNINFAISSGMITSEIGLLEIPHLWAPAGVYDLAKNIKVVHDPDVFPIDVSLIFIRGIKNYFPKNATYKDIRKIDFMRGEETQIAGLLSLYPDFPPPFIVIILSSHTKYIFVTENRKISGCLTTLSGQIYEALKKQTNVGKSIVGIGEKDNNYLDTNIVDIAYDVIENVGFLRSLIMPRFMEVLLKTKWYERELFVNSAITAEDLKVVNDFKLLNFSLSNSNFILVGHKNRCEILNYMLKEYCGAKNKIKMIYKKEDVDKLVIEGAISIAEKAGYYKGDM
jgi:2-dehydro-3-deoxygalactonokinase